MSLLESEDFADLYTLNFHLQTLGLKYRTNDGLLVVVHDKDANNVEMLIAKDENSLFIS